MDEKEILAKCDVALDASDPDFEEKLVKAMGLKPGEKVEIVPPTAGQQSRWISIESPNGRLMIEVCQQIIEWTPLPPPPEGE